MATTSPTIAPPKVSSRSVGRVNRARVRTDTEEHAALRVRRIPVGKCRLHKYNQFRDVGDLRGLADLIRTQGLEQPITVQEHDGWYEVVDGGRRFLAVQQLLERRTIAAYVRAPRPNDEVLAATVATDIHKRPMTQVERGNVVRMLQDAHWDVADLAAYWGVAESTIYTWVSQARAAEAALDSVDSADTDGAAPGSASRLVAATTAPARPRQRAIPKWKAAVGELQRRWENRIGDHGLDREQATALLAELGDLAGDTNT